MQSLVSFTIPLQSYGLMRIYSLRKQLWQQDREIAPGGYF